jgi:hypothetical protein
VAVSTTNGFSAGQPRVIASRTLGESGGPIDILHAQLAADGRILAEIPSVTAAPLPFRLLINWNR